MARDAIELSIAVGRDERGRVAPTGQIGTTGA